MLDNLPRHFRLGLQWAAVIVLVFVAFMGYAMRAAPAMLKEADASLNAFYVRCQNHSYGRAYQLLSPELRESMTQADLAAAWQKYEKDNGRIRKWEPALGGSITFGGRTNFIPPFVDYTHRVTGTQEKTIGNATVVYIRMVPRDGKWQLQKFSFMR